MGSLFLNTGAALFSGPKTGMLVRELLKQVREVDAMVQLLFVLGSSLAAACFALALNRQLTYPFEHRSLCKNMNLRSAIDLTQRA